MVPLPLETVTQQPPPSWRVGAERQSPIGGGGGEDEDDEEEELLGRDHRFAFSGSPTP